MELQMVKEADNMVRFFLQYYTSRVLLSIIVNDWSFDM